MGCQISKNSTPVRDLRIPTMRRRLFLCCVHPETSSPSRTLERSQLSPSAASPSKRMVNNNHLANPAPGAVMAQGDEFDSGSILPLEETTSKLESQRSSAQSGHRSRDSALASSVSSVHTPPADGPHSHYFDPIATPLNYSTKAYKGPYFNNQDLITPASYRPSPIMEQSPASPMPPSPVSVHSSPRIGAAASPERSNSPPIRPQTSSPIPLQSAQQSPRKMMEASINPMERPLPIPSEIAIPAEPPHLPGGGMGFSVPMVPKARPPRSISKIPTSSSVRRGPKSSSLGRTGRNGSAHSSSSSLMDESPQVPIRKPTEALSTCQMQMGSQDWTTVTKGLKTLSNLVQNHPEVLTNDLHMVVTVLVTQIKNLRSQVSRAACQVAGEMAIHLKRALEHECDDLVAPLLLRSADTNKFLRNDCNDALDKIMQNLPPHKTLHALISHGANHKNAIVRTTASRLLYEQVHRMGADRVMNSLSRDGRNKLLKTIANFLTEGSQETRDWAKRTMQCLVAHEQFEAALEQAVSPNTIRAIDKTLKVLKGRVPSK